MIQRERWTGRRAADLDSEQQQRVYAGGYEPGPDGCMTGRDPRCMSPDELEVIGHQLNIADIGDPCEVSGVLRRQSE